MMTRLDLALTGDIIELITFVPVMSAFPYRGLSYNRGIMSSDGIYTVKCLPVQQLDNLESFAIC